MQIIPNFLVFEGGDGSGTTTQLKMLSERLKNSRYPKFFPTFEPTDGLIGRLIRSALKKDADFSPQTLAMLFAADRSEHIYGSKGILERANLNELVICDRYVLSSLVYQGIECGDELPQSLNSRFPAPETLIFLDIDPEIALQRIGMYSSAGVRVHTIDASKDADKVAAEVWSAVSQMRLFQNLNL